VVVRGDVVTRTFARLGWTWGGDWSDPDYQHFDAR
jgi:poly-gamma-glutamate synthesis protein (capsule biosynthesis protein)